VSPSSGLPGLFPVPYELGLQRLGEEFGLVPVEYPTTRQMNADPKDRAADLNAAFADPSITRSFRRSAARTRSACCRTSTAP